LYINTRLRYLFIDSFLLVFSHFQAILTIQQLFDPRSGSQVKNIGFIKEQLKMCNSIDEAEKLNTQLITKISNDEFLQS
jgi:hypothetical protein